jgi:hypothetical protein
LKRDSSTGEWCRCSKYVGKGDCLAHQKSGKHKYTIARADDPGFLAHFDERREEITLQRSFKQIHEVIALFCAQTNVSVREVGREVMTDFVRDIFSIAVRFAPPSPSFDPRTLPAMTPTLLSRKIRMIGG